MTNWKSVLELNQNRCVVSGSQAALAVAIGQGADLRIYTEFNYHEHIEPGSPNQERVQEVSDFRVTYLIENRWVAGIMNLRVPAQPPQSFGPRISMSFFMYNQNGQQAIARPFLDGKPCGKTKGASPIDNHKDMPKYHQIDNWDVQTNAPSSNFIYDFGVYRFFVRNSWRQVFSADADGKVINGSLDELTKAFARGCEIKVAVRGICQDMIAPAETMLDHEVFMHAGPCYYNTQQRLFTTESQPAVRVRPNIPMQYSSDGWDFGWFLLRTDGFVSYWRCDPYTLEFKQQTGQYSIRWFVEDMS